MQQAQDSKSKQSCICQWLLVTEHIGDDMFRQSGETHDLVMETHMYQQLHNNIDIEMISSHCSGHRWHSFSTAVLPQACDCLLPAAWLHVALRDHELACGVLLPGTDGLLTHYLQSHCCCQ